MRFFIQQVAQTLDDVLMGISSFFVFVFRQSFAFLSSQFSCFIETWATNKRAGWLFCERKFHYSSFIGIILYRDQNFDDWNFHLFVNPSYWGRSPKMESAWPPTARFGGGGGGGVCRLLYWNPGWLTWASIIYSGWKINTSGVSSWFANWKLVSYLYTYIYVKNTQHTHVYIYIHVYHLVRKFLSQGARERVLFLASLPDVFGRFRSSNWWRASTVAAGADQSPPRHFWLT